jgi:hypothetical protein
VDDVFFGVNETSTTLFPPTTTTLTMITTTTISPDAGCADPVLPYGESTVSDALYVLAGAVGRHGCDPCLCDTDASGTVTALDAMTVLKSAVGFPVLLQCDPCS